MHKLFCDLKQEINQQWTEWIGGVMILSIN